jgi:hypothetical protein
MADLLSRVTPRDCSETWMHVSPQADVVELRAAGLAGFAELLNRLLETPGMDSDEDVMFTEGSGGTGAALDDPAQYPIAVLATGNAGHLQPNLPSCMWTPITDGSGNELGEYTEQSYKDDRPSRYGVEPADWEAYRALLKNLLDLFSRRDPSTLSGNESENNVSQTVPAGMIQPAFMIQGITLTEAVPNTGIHESERTGTKDSRGVSPAWNVRSETFLRETCIKDGLITAVPPEDRGNASLNLSGSNWQHPGSFQRGQAGKAAPSEWQMVSNVNALGVDQVDSQTDDAKEGRVLTVTAQQAAEGLVISLEGQEETGTKTMEKKADGLVGKEDHGFISANGAVKSYETQSKEANPACGGTAFSTAMVDKIDKLVEQYANRSKPQDVVVRLRIDDGESLLVGLKTEGQKIGVEIRASNESMLNLLQASKDEITRHLEDKHVYAELYIDPNGHQRFEKRGRNEHERRQTNGEKEREGFTALLETLA